ncbi:hypothetical protein A3770_13p67920 [Chloropicon primus]|uniref:Uncharacterized protein n=1 Tax=Chloropicon primus TaxID=1764295 RepID=A0A5B8MXS9_9CHLO|nr:hypothetical protein A3770_13p67920 [Chloropicon primus]|eukprot:QDZ24274.1 hypothetical protein A3770_13p67920 [Chloropicon primus]
MATRMATSCASWARQCGGETSTSRARGQLCRRRSGILSMSLLFLGVGQRDAGAIPLAPLGKALTDREGKRVGLPVEEVKAILERGLREGQYFVNPEGLPNQIFDDNARFKDPTNDVVGLSRYEKALGLLFDKERSKVELLDIEVTSPGEIRARYRLGGYLKFAWNPCVRPYEGVVRYGLGKDGLVVSQEQEWSISGAEALKETFSACEVPPDF